MLNMNSIKLYKKIEMYHEEHVVGTSQGLLGTSFTIT